MTPAEAQAEALNRIWFYSFELPSGERTPSYYDGRFDPVHETRLAMLDSVLDAHYPGPRSALSAVDLACHQGYFAHQLAQRGFAPVLGIDARPSHVADAELIARAYGHDQLSFLVSDVHDLPRRQLPAADLVLCFGLLYHLENPIGALRVARSLCRDLLVVETQVAPGLTGVVDWGSYQFVRAMHGSFALIDETGETHGPEASTLGLCLAPSVDALCHVLSRLGFVDIALVPPPEDGYEQLRFGKRVMVRARVPAVAAT